MRATGVFKSQWTVQRRSILVFLLALFLIASVGAIFTSYQTKTFGVVITETGQYVENVEYYGMAQYNNPETFGNTIFLTWCLIALSISFAGKYRRFFISLSVSRYELLIGNFLHLVSLAALFTVAAWLIPFLSRLVLLSTGFRFAQGVSTREIILGSSKNVLFDGIRIFCEFVLAIGIGTFVGYLFVRWWKIILVLMGTGVVMLIVVASQHALGRNMELLTRFIIWLQDWMSTSLLPFLKSVLRAPITWRSLLYYFLTGVVFTGLSYPILRRMPVK